MTLHLATKHVRGGRLRLAEEIARDLLASDSARTASSCSWELRCEQGWMSDVVQLARERFRVALPGRHDDRAAALRMHVARVASGARPGDGARADARYCRGGARRFMRNSVVMIRLLPNRREYGP